MKQSFFRLLFTLLFCCSMWRLDAQDNQEAVHTCFQINPERVISIPLMQTAKDSSSFSCDFDHPGTGNGKQVFVRIPGMKFPYTLKINRFTFGSDPGSGLAAVYNISPFLKEKANRIEVIPATGEPGAGRGECPACGSAALIVRDGIHIRDVVIKTYMEADKQSVFTRIHLYIKSYLEENNTGSTLDMRVTDPGGRKIFSKVIELGSPLSFGQERELNFDIDIVEPMTWSPVHPRLYKVEMEQSLRGKKTGEKLVAHFGIRSAVLSDSLMIFNGDTLQLDLADEALVQAMTTLPEEEIRELIKESTFSAILYRPTFPCYLVRLFEQEGKVLILTEEQQVLDSGHAHLNSPSLIPSH